MISTTAYYNKHPPNSNTQFTTLSIKWHQFYTYHPKISHFLFIFRSSKHNNLFSFAHNAKQSDEKSSLHVEYMLLWACSSLFTQSSLNDNDKVNISIPLFLSPVSFHYNNGSLCKCLYVCTWKIVYIFRLDYCSLC